MRAVAVGNNNEDHQDEVAQLAEGIRNGSDVHQERFYRMVNRGLKWMLVKHLDSSDVDDGVHDVFMAVVRAIQMGRLDKPESLIAFTRTIARRYVAKYIEGRIDVRRRTVPLDDGHQLSSHAPNSEMCLTEVENQKIALELLRTMAPLAREVLVRFYVHEQSKDQICRDLALTDTQFRLLKSRSKQRFTDALRKKVERRPIPVMAVPLRVAL